MRANGAIAATATTEAMITPIAIAFCRSVAGMVAMTSGNSCFSGGADAPVAASDNEAVAARGATNRRRLMSVPKPLRGGIPLRPRDVEGGRALRKAAHH